jgi:hypothetical protein
MQLFALCSVFKDYSFCFLDAFIRQVRTEVRVYFALACSIFTKDYYRKFSFCNSRLQTLMKIDHALNSCFKWQVCGSSPNWMALQLLSHKHRVAYWFSILEEKSVFSSPCCLSVLHSYFLNNINLNDSIYHYELTRLHFRGLLHEAHWIPQTQLTHTFPPADVRVRVPYMTKSF